MIIILKIQKLEINCQLVHRKVLIRLVKRTVKANKVNVKENQEELG